MSNYVKLASDAADQYLSSLSDTQEQFLKYASAVSASIPAPAPMPAFDAAQAVFPTPREVVEANFAFAAKLLAQQKEFAEKLFAVSAR